MSTMIISTASSLMIICFPRREIVIRRHIIELKSVHMDSARRDMCFVPTHDDSKSLRHAQTRNCSFTSQPHAQRVGSPVGTAAVHRQRRAALRERNARRHKTHRQGLEGRVRAPPESLYRCAFIDEHQPNDCDDVTHSSNVRVMHRVAAVSQR